MKKQMVLLFLLAISIIAMTHQSVAQNSELQRFVFGSGGSVYSSNGSSTISGMTGQTAIFTVSQTGVSPILHQGFWVTGGDSLLVGVDEQPITLSPDLMNFPNPFSTNTTIRYILPGTGFVNIRIFDMVGRLRKSFALGVQSPGMQEIAWDGKDEAGIDCASGSYMFELSVSPYMASLDGQFKEVNLRNIMVIMR